MGMDFPEAKAEMERVKICLKCGARNPWSATQCRKCGYNRFRKKKSRKMKK